MSRLMDDLDLETPEVDAAEQATSVPGWQDDEPDEAETPEEENRIVGYDDDYR